MPPRILCSLPLHTQQHSAGSAVQTACCSHGEWKTICLTSQRLRKHKTAPLLEECESQAVGIFKRAVLKILYLVWPVN